MRKFTLSCLLVALLFVIPLTVFVMPDTANLQNERRTIAAFPKLPSPPRSRAIKTFFQGVDAFFADRFPLRKTLLTLPMTIQEAGHDNLDISKCYRGKDNWLFLGNSYARTVDALQGGITLSGTRLKKQTEAYQGRNDTAKRYGADFFVFIGPNKSSVYPEYLPRIVVPSTQRFFAPLLSSLQKAGVKVYDPTERLRSAKAEGLLYYRTDTHWNALGAYEAFEGFRQYAGLAALPPLSMKEIPPGRGDLLGIGGYDDFPLSPGDNFLPDWAAPLTLRQEQDGLTVNDSAPSDKTVWVFGDSFSVGLQPYMTAMFKETRVFKHNEFDAIFASALRKPDMVIWVVVERNFASPD